MTTGRGKLVVISGPSGAGKTSVCRALKEHPDVEFSVSATTRAMRAGERDGVDYHFLSREDFQRRLDENQFLEWASYNGNLYGTPRWPMDAALARGKTILVEIEVKGTRQLRERGVVLPPWQLEGGETIRQLLIGEQRLMGFLRAYAQEREAQIVRQEAHGVEKDSLLAEGSGQHGVDLVDDQQPQPELPRKRAGARAHAHHRRAD